MRKSLLLVGAFLTVAAMAQAKEVDKRKNSLISKDDSIDD